MDTFRILGEAFEKNSSLCCNFTSFFDSTPLFNFSGASSSILGFSAGNDSNVTSDEPCPPPDIIMHPGMKTWKELDSSKPIIPYLIIDENCSKCNECVRLFEAVRLKFDTERVGSDRAWKDAISTNISAHNPVRLPIVMLNSALWWSISSPAQWSALAHALLRIQSGEAPYPSNPAAVVDTNLFRFCRK